MFAELGIEDRILWAPIGYIRYYMGFPWKRVYTVLPIVIWYAFEPGQLDQMKSYGNQGNTVNNLILSALYRLCLSVVYDQPMQIPITVDLRRYLPDHKTEAIRNFFRAIIIPSLCLKMIPLMIPYLRLVIL